MEDLNPTHNSNGNSSLYIYLIAKNTPNAKWEDRIPKTKQPNEERKNKEKDPKIPKNKNKEWRSQLRLKNYCTTLKGEVLKSLVELLE